MPDTSSPVVRDLRGDGWHVRLDLAPQVLSLGAPDEHRLHEGEAPLAAGWRGGQPESQQRGFVSASSLAITAKLFDDGLYAAVDLALQTDTRGWLAQLAAAGPTMTAAARMAGLSVPTSPESERLAADFIANQGRSKPLGFYTWSDELRRVFQQDRLLQSTLEPHEAAAVVAALDADPGLASWYARHLDLVARATNPAPGSTDLRHPGGRQFFPSSRSHEGDLMDRLVGDRWIPGDFSLANAMLERLRDGSLNVAPTERSGWYDFQTWALEPLAVPERMPEGTRLRLDEPYRAQLADLFRSVLALTRETHVKQLPPLPCGAALRQPPPDVVVHVLPALSLEPVRCYYSRRAEGYAFIRRVLEPLGLERMHRQTASGPVARSLAEELDETAAIFRGAAGIVGQELGIETADERDAATFRAWASRPHGEDIRMMVPVFYDRGRKQMKVWAILGWAARPLTVSFEVPPVAQVLAGRARVEFGREWHRLAYPVFAETYVTRLLDRDQFQRLCDREKTATRILEHLTQPG